MQVMLKRKASLSLAQDHVGELDLEKVTIIEAAEDQDLTAVTKPHIESTEKAVEIEETDAMIEETTEEIKDVMIDVTTGEMREEMIAEKIVTDIAREIEEADQDLTEREDTLLKRIKT